MKKRKLQQTDTLISARDVFIRSCNAKNLSERTVEFYERGLNEFVNYTGNISSNEIDVDTINRFLVYGKNRGLSAGTIAGWARTLKRFMNFNQLDVRVEKVKEITKQIKPFTEGQINLLLKAPEKNTFSGLRDYAMMVLMLDTGVRISEVTGLCRQDINLRAKKIDVLRKGGRYETLPIGESCTQALKEYLPHVDDLPEDKPIFVTVYNNPLNRQTVNKRLKEYAKKMRITGVRVSAHTFRHTFAKTYLMNGGDMESLRKLMGHTTLTMVKKYLNLLAKDMETQHKKYSPADSILKKRRR